MRVAAILATAGIRINAQQANSSKEIFVVEVPSGIEYLFSRAGLLKLRNRNKLNVPGVEESGVLR
jgi:hypothetical protein